MLVRMPSAEVYASQVEREQRWLPYLAPRLPVGIPEPLAMGLPSCGYPWRWSVCRWIDGDSLDTTVADPSPLASDLAGFLCALHAIETTDGPAAGAESFYRGGPLRVYDDETRQAAAALQGRLDVGLALSVWERALHSAWNKPPVWVHGDISAGNLLIRAGKLVAVIDFGQLSVGDPACDLVPAWTLFDARARSLFRASIPLDPDTWARGRAWALWKAMLVAAGLSETNAVEGTRCWRTINEVLVDHRAAA